MSDQRSVVITGVGAISPLGVNAFELWTSLLLGRSGVRRLSEDWAIDLPVPIAAPVSQDPMLVLGATRCRRLDRVQQLALVAALEA